MLDHAHSITSVGFHPKHKSEMHRSRPSRHAQHRSSSHHHHSNSHYANFSDSTAPEEEAHMKRPYLLTDVSRRSSGHSDTLSSTDSYVNSNSVDSPPQWVSLGYKVVAIKAKPLSGP